MSARTSMRAFAMFLACSLALGGFACRHRNHDDTSGDEEEVRPIPRGSSRAELCSETGDQYIQMPYDTNGDGAADVIRVYLVSANATQNGQAAARRIVCREADLNSDGVRDVMRVYDEQGRVAREQQDRDFDQRPDYWMYYEDGRLIRTDEDANRDGRVDTRVFLDPHGQPERIERDEAARSVSGSWRPDHFEFYDHGRIIRSGVDTDFDGAVDRWDRDDIFQAELDARERAGGGDEGDSDAAAAADAGVPAATDAGVRPSASADAGVRPAVSADAGVARVNDAGRPATTAPR